MGGGGGGGVEGNYCAVKERPFEPNRLECQEFASVGGDPVALRVDRVSFSDSTYSSRGTLALTLTREIERVLSGIVLSPRCQILVDLVSWPGCRSRSRRVEWKADW